MTKGWEESISIVYGNSYGSVFGLKKWFIILTFIPLGLASGVNPIFDRVVFFGVVVQADKKNEQRSNPTTEEYIFLFFASIDPPN